MYSYERMPASHVAGLDMFNFSGYWNTIKNKISEIQLLGNTISQHQQKLGIAKYNLEQRGRKDLAAQLDDEIKKTQDDLDKWWKVKGYIDKYLPEWVKASKEPSTPTVNTMSPTTGGAYVAPSTAQEFKGWVSSWFGGSDVSGMGALPILLGAAAIAALAYSVNVGMALLQDYQFKKHLTSQIIEGKMTSGQAVDILSVPKEKGVLEETIGKVGVGLGFGIPVLLLIGGGLYLAVTTGMLKNMFGKSS